MEYKPQYKYFPPLSWQWLTPFYDFFCFAAGFGKSFRKKVLRVVPVKNGETVVDIGCGTGVFLKFAQEKHPNAKFIGVDPDHAALQIASKRFKRAGLKIELKEAFAEVLPLARNSIDICFSTLAFHHMPDEIKRKAIEEIYRVLKPGGHVVIADFGPIESTLIQKVLFFRTIEYMKGNLKGLIPLYLKQVGFRGIRTAGSHLRGIKILVAQR